MTGGVIASEADLIALLAPLTFGAPGAFALKDDCALLTPRAGFDLVLKTDPVRAGIHFFADDPPDAIAWKALAVGVSDLAAKGAAPQAYLLAMSFPEAPTRTWAERFVAGLDAAQMKFGCTLVGGDTDRAPGPLSIGITVIGEVPTGTMVRRDQARAGDAIVVSGSLGDAALGLELHREARGEKRALRERWTLDDGTAETLIDRYLRPEPRLALGATLRGLASAAMDVSDGLVKDLERMCKASGVGAIVEADRLPLSAAMKRVLAKEPERFVSLVLAGDDYEILAAVPQERLSKLIVPIDPAQPRFHQIGTFAAAAGAEAARVVVRGRDGKDMALDRTGWDHF